MGLWWLGIFRRALTGFSFIWSYSWTRSKLMRLRTLLSVLQ
jgi:hypothetical protein